MLARLLLILAVAFATLAPGAQAARTLLVTEHGTDSVGAFDLTREGAATAFPGGLVASGGDAGGVAISPDARFVFIANTQANTVRPFAIGDDRTLTAISAEVATGGTGPSAIAVTPDGHRLLVAHRSGGTVSVFDINQTTGALTAAALAQPVGFDDVDSVVVAHDGRFAYVTGRGPSGPPPSNADTRLGWLAINANGTLTPLVGSPLTLAGALGGFGLSITPDGGRIYMPLGNEQTIRVFNVDTASGVPTQAAASPFAAGAAPQQATVSPDGTHLYTNDPGGTALLGYALNAATGAPTAVTGSPFGLGAFHQPSAIALAPDGRTLFAPIAANPTIVAGYAVGATGTLTTLSGAPFAGPGAFSSFYSAAITPTQTPTGTVSVTPGAAGTPSAFTATAQARGGFVTRYDWTFGDGASASDGGPETTHTYASPGSYTAKLTLTNDCDPAAVFVNGSVYTGRTTYCNGPRTATIERAVVVSAVSTPAPAPGPASPPAPAPAAPAFTVARAFTLPSARRCLRRPARLTLTARRPSGVTVNRVEVRIAGKRLVLRTGAAARKSIKLRKLPAKTFTLTIKVTPRGGKTVTTKRTYTVCKR